ncbi:hypothetical protein [Streptomyces sp. NPDC051214]|uniref:hypothetical protein n=1 Tax=Streptomyces sp. NPDC051214 TaxID=3155282 RepID=UPI0034160827
MGSVGTGGPVHCSALGSWQQETGEAAGSDGLGGHILEDTTRAVAGDMAAEGRAMSYCDDAGYETLMKAGQAS